VRVRIAVVAAVGALVTAGAAMAVGSAAPPTLKGTVGPGFTISLKNSKGKKVTTLKAGKYKFVVTDKASIHNFYVEKQKGGSFHKAITTIPGTGTKTVTISLSKGTYKYYCQAHESQMHGFITVS
jgi:plastocyanin